jgi:type VI secretion system protein ImpA
MTPGIRALAPEIPSDLAPDLLCAPISGPRPTGQEVRYAGDYDSVIEARRHDNAALPQGVWQRELKRADWPEVERLCIQILTTRAKDLQVASWLTEAWICLRGFTGLEAGLGLLSRLCERYWPDLYPAIEKGDLSARIAPVEWLNDKLPELLRSLPVVTSASDTEERFSWTDYVNAQRLESVRQRDRASAERAEAAGAVTLARFSGCAQRTQTATLKETEAALKQALNALAALNDVLRKNCGKDAPGLAAIRSVLEEVLAFVSAELVGRGKPAPLAFLTRKRAPAPSDAVATAQPLEASAAVPELRTRDDAYREIAQIAEFLLRVEPHSPTPYLLQRAAAWGELPLPELVQQLSQSGSDLSRLFADLGLLQPAGIAENDDYSE